MLCSEHPDHSTYPESETCLSILPSIRKGPIGSACARSSGSRRAPGPKAGTSRSILLISAPSEIRRRLGRITRGCRHRRQIGGAYGSVVPFPPRGVRATTLLSVLKVRHGSLESPRRKTHRVASKGQERRWRSEKSLALPYDPVKPDASFQRSRSPLLGDQVGTGLEIYETIPLYDVHYAYTGGGVMTSHAAVRGLLAG